MRCVLRCVVCCVLSLIGFSLSMIVVSVSRLSRLIAGRLRLSSASVYHHHHTTHHHNISLSSALGALPLPPSHLEGKHIIYTPRFRRRTKRNRRPPFATTTLSETLSHRVSPCAQQSTTSRSKTWRYSQENTIKFAAHVRTTTVRLPVKKKKKKQTNWLHHFAPIKTRLLFISGLGFRHQRINIFHLELCAPSLSISSARACFRTVLVLGAVLKSSPRERNISVFVDCIDQFIILQKYLLLCVVWW